MRIFNYVNTIVPIVGISYGSGVLGQATNVVGSYIVSRSTFHTIGIQYIPISNVPIGKVGLQFNYSFNNYKEEIGLINYEAILKYALSIDAILSIDLIHNQIFDRSTVALLIIPTASYQSYITTRYYSNDDDIVFEESSTYRAGFTDIGIGFNYRVLNSHYSFYYHTFRGLSLSFGYGLYQSN